MTPRRDPGPGSRHRLDGDSVAIFARNELRMGGIGDGDRQAELTGRVARSKQSSLAEPVTVVLAASIAVLRINRTVVFRMPGIFSVANPSTSRAAGSCRQGRIRTAWCIPCKIRSILWLLGSLPLAFLTRWQKK
jgi:hypothetical protein